MPSRPWVGLTEWATATLNALPTPTLGVDLSGTIVAANDAAANLLGCARGALLGTSVEALVPEADRARHLLHRASFPSRGAPRLMTSSPEVPLRRPGGDVLYVKIGLGSIALREGRFRASRRSPTSPPGTTSTAARSRCSRPRPR